MISYDRHRDEQEDRLRKMLLWRQWQSAEKGKPQMIVVWNEESTDIVPDPYRFEDLKANAMKLITPN
jgi:hypothetical protein